MKRSILLPVIIILTLVLLAGNLPLLTAQDDAPRTYYESLDLSSPEAAVLTFSSAFQRLDFPTVYLVLAPHAQLIMPQQINLLRFDSFARVQHWEAVAAEVSVFKNGFGHGEHSDGDMSYLFDEIMLGAVKHDALLIDLRGDVTILDARPSSVVDDRYPAIIDVSTLIEGISGEVVFRVVQAPSGRWRILQVIIPGGNEEQLPWSALPPVSVQASISWNAPCPDTAQEPSGQSPNAPSISAMPDCGMLTGMLDADGNQIESDMTVMITGANFVPDIPVRLYLSYRVNDNTARHEMAEDQIIVPDAEGRWFIAVLPSIRIRGDNPTDIEVVAIQRYSP